MVSKVKKDNYIVIQGWMITDLDLKGNELIVYACIYGFSQAEEQVFSGSLQYLADWTNSTKQGVLKCLKSLVEKGFLKKEDRFINGVKFCEYSATKFNEVLNKVEYGMQQSLIGGMQQSLPNNISLDNINNKTDINYQQIADMYNEICISFPHIRTLSEARKKAIRARVHSGYTMDDFKEIFTRAEQSTFLKGGNDRNWAATFDWMLKDSNAVKILEGNYTDKAPAAHNSNANGLVTINGKQYIKKNGKYYVPNGSNIAVDPFAPDDLPF